MSRLKTNLYESIATPTGLIDMFKLQLIQLTIYLNIIVDINEFKATLYYTKRSVRKKIKNTLGCMKITTNERTLPFRPSLTLPKTRA